MKGRGLVNLFFKFLSFLFLFLFQVVFVFYLFVLALCPFFCLCYPFSLSYFPRFALFCLFGASNISKRVNIYNEICISNEEADNHKGKETKSSLIKEA